MLYRALIRPLLFRMDPEDAHHLALKVLTALHRRPALCAFLARRLGAAPSFLAVRLWDLEFAHPVGLAPGFDKDARCPRAAWALGFSFVELGTVTLRPQPGNPRPRVFRIPEAEALINRIGFSSAGVEAFAASLARSAPLPIPVGVSLGRNRDTPPERAPEEYARCFAAVAPWASFVVLNISSPNTPGLRDLQQGQWLRPLLAAVSQARQAFAAASGRRVPLLVKVAPDLNDAQLEELVDIGLEQGIDGFVTTNTTATRPGLRSPVAAEPGGLSGRPLEPLALRVTARVYRLCGGRVPLIGTGGIFTPEDVYRRLRAGASLVQVYTAFVYRGPLLAHRLVEGLARLFQRDGVRRVEEVVGVEAERWAREPARAG